MANPLFESMDEINRGGAVAAGNTGEQMQVRVLVRAVLVEAAVKLRPHPALC